MPLPKWEALSEQEKREITEAAKCIRVTFQMKSYPEGYVIIWW